MAPPDTEDDDDAARAGVIRLLKRSNDLYAAACSRLAQAGAPPTRRGFLAASMAAVSVEHWGAQRILLREGHFATAFAIVRLQFEVVARAVWILECAKDNWLERFSAPMADGQLGEPVLGPPVPAMLSAIAIKVPLVAGMLSQLKDGAWEPMHSYVHGGVRPVAQSLAGTTHYQVSTVLRNANGLGLIAVNAMTRGLQDARLLGFVARLQREYGDCLPPSTTASS